MTRMITLSQALDRLDRDRASWQRFQVGYAPAKSGQFQIQSFDIDRSDMDRLRIIRDEGMDRDPGYGTFTRLVEYIPGAGLEGAPKRQTWMSDTRAEIMEHTPIFNKLWWARIDRRPLRLLVNGLGLGLVVHGAIKHYGVDHVDVVESNPHVVEMVAPLLPSDKVTVHLGDAYNIRWPKGTRWDFAWHDIWPDISDENLPGMDQLRAKYKNRVHWQGCWQRRGCLTMARYMRELKDGTLDPMKAFLILSGKVPL